MEPTVLHPSSLNPDAVAVAADMQAQTVFPSFVAIVHLSIVEVQSIEVARAAAVSLEVPKWHFNPD